MKVAVSSSGRDLNAQLDPRFGRCSYFLIIETRIDMSFEVFENENACPGRRSRHSIGPVCSFPKGPRL